MLVKITAIIQKEDDWYVAKCLENNVASQGKTIEEAIINLKEAVQLYSEI
jgi:predicted RNase H-like HicB family nuclease